MVQVRAIFLSDVHLGTRNCQADKLLAFLREHEAKYLYLVGDIVDFWAMRRSVYWSPAQNTVVQKILKRARHGVRVVFIPGNHDESLRGYAGFSFGDILVACAAVHHAADGRRYLLMHGDQFDQITRFHRWLTVAGDRGYTALMWLNVLLTRIRMRLGCGGYWSLSSYVKRKLKHAVEYVHEFEQAVARYAGEQGFDGVICGHIHAAAHKHIDGVTYLNCGDWVDSCSALVEHHDGRFELLDWDALASVGSNAVDHAPLRLIVGSKSDLTAAGAIDANARRLARSLASGEQ